MGQPHLFPKQAPNVFFSGLIVVAMFILPGCGLSELTQVACQTAGNDPHCSQEAAVQSGDVDNCDKVAQKEEFKKIGSNPPRDKCIIMVSANNESPSNCDNIKGGLMSYSKEDCLKAISDTAHDPAACSKIGVADMSPCLNNVAQKTFDDIDKLKNMKTKSPQDIQELQQHMQDLEKMTELLTNINKSRLDIQKTVVNNLRS